MSYSIQTQYTTAEIEEHVTRWIEENKESGISKAEYGRKYGINGKKLSNWVCNRHGVIPSGTSMGYGSKYSAEERDEHVRRWKEENAATGITRAEYSRKNGLDSGCFSAWVYNRSKKEEDVIQHSIVRIDSKNQITSAPGIKIEYCGANISVESKDNLVLVLSALSGIHS